MEKHNNPQEKNNEIIIVLLTFHYSLSKDTNY
ncbi:hypothetical protein G5O_0953 [Chlamydia psittaci 6BC]|nr:hypothetical protein G5O_0953 [Chlamydia psittaci 6BC]